MVQDYDYVFFTCNGLPDIDTTRQFVSAILICSFAFLLFAFDFFYRKWHAFQMIQFTQPTWLETKQKTTIPSYYAYNMCIYHCCFINNITYQHCWRKLWDVSSYVYKTRTDNCFTEKRIVFIIPRFLDFQSLKWVGVHLGE
jgi:hypothetical protein